MNDKKRHSAEFEPVYISMGRESWSRVIAICVLIFAGVWAYYTFTTAIMVTSLLALLLTGYIQVFTHKVVGPAANNVSIWLTTRKTAEMAETASTEIENPMWIGYYNRGEAVMTNLDRLGSVAIWGIKGSGKTTLLHTLIYEMTCAHKPSELQIVIFDHGKDGNDYSIFNRMPYLHGIPVAESERDAERLLTFLEEELDRRSKLLKKVPDWVICNDLDRYHNYREKQNLHKELPRIPRMAILVDEAQDLTGNKRALEILIKIAKKGRFVGIFPIIATQYPNASSIPGDLRSQLETRFCGFLASPREYHIVAEITKEFTEGVTLGTGQFFMRLVGYEPWTVINAIMIPENELTSYAARICHGHTMPTFADGRLPQVTEDEPQRQEPLTKDLPDRIAWRSISGTAAKQIAFMEFLQKYDERPNAPEVLAHFVMTRKTAYACLNKYWPMREKELRR